MKLPAKYLLTNHLYIDLNVYKLMTDVTLLLLHSNMFTNHIYICVCVCVCV